MSCDHIEFLGGFIVVGLGLGERDVSDGAEHAVIVEPVDPAQCRHLHRLCIPPRSLPPGVLGLVEAVDGLGQGVVIAVADAADR